MLDRAENDGKVTSQSNFNLVFLKDFRMLLKVVYFNLVRFEKFSGQG